MKRQAFSLAILLLSAGFYFSPINAQEWITTINNDAVTNTGINKVGILDNNPAFELTVDGDIGLTSSSAARSIIGNTTGSLAIYSKGANWNDGSAILLSSGNTSTPGDGLASFVSAANSGNLAFRFVDKSWNYLLTINSYGDVEAAGNMSFSNSTNARSIVGNTSHSLGIYSGGANWTDGSAILLGAGNGPSQGEGLASFLSTAQGGNLAFRFTDRNWNHLFTVNAIGDIEARGNCSFSYSPNARSIVGNTSHSLGIYSGGANWTDGSAILLGAGNGPSQGEGLASFLSTAQGGNLAFRFTDRNWNHLFTVNAIGDIEARGNCSFSYSPNARSIVGNTSHSLGIYSQGANWTDGSAILLSAGNSSTPGAGLASFFSTAASGNLAFRFTDKNWNHLMTIDADGQVVIGGVSTVNPNNYKLYVQTGILTEKLKIANSSDPLNWADFVFDDDYQLPGIYEVEQFIKANKHLPEIPTAQEIAEDGIDVAEMDAKLLQKIEELTLYVIKQQREIDELKDRLNK